MANVTLDNLTKNYGGGALSAVQNLSLEIKDGEFLVLLGPSGCGKSTALRMIAGLEEITDGAVWIGDEFVNDIHPKDRDIAMVFQNYALYPHMSVYDNIAFALQIQKRPKSEIDQRVREAARILELEDLLKRRPGQLSGGQRQRVAMGRAIVRKPAVFLMDEPLSNLDAKLRVQMRAEIAQIQHRLGVTTVYVTHDQTEAMTMGDRVALLRDGVLQQVDTPDLIYNRPVNTFVATFIGSPTMNLYYANAGEVGAGGLPMAIGSNHMTVPAATLEKRPGLARHAGKRIIVGVRPEDLSDATLHPTPPDSTITLDVDLVEALGSDIIVHFSLDAEGVSIRSSDALQELNVEQTKAGRGIARLTPKSRVGEGHAVTLAVDMERLHFFDAASNTAIWE
jgi:multiple sugar transport system ATP-binding protein